MFAVYEKMGTLPLVDIVWEEFRCDEGDDDHPVRSTWWVTPIYTSGSTPPVSFPTASAAMAWVREKMEPRRPWTSEWALWPSRFEARPIL